MIAASVSRTVLFFGVLLQILSSVGASANDGFMNGVDISALTALEDDGALYRDAQGTIGDPLVLLDSAGIDWYRLRLFVNPNGVGQVVNDLNYTISLAQRARDAGGKVLLDLHYSDTWADPGRQIKPRAWEELGFDELVTQVRAYTNSVVTQFRQAGVTPDAVQIGNEVSNGMLWDDGRLFYSDNRSAELNRFAELLKAGIAGVEQAAVGSAAAPETWIHIADGSDWNASNYLLNELEGRGVEFDTVAYSYYPRFHGTNEDVRTTLEQTSRVYGTSVALAEVGFAHAGEIFEPQAEQFVFDVSPQGQRDFAANIVETVGNVPHGQGRGVFWWHGDAVPTTSGLAWEGGRLGLFDSAGRILPSASALGANPVRSSVQVFHEGNIHHGTPSNAVGQSFQVGLESLGSEASDSMLKLLRVKFVSGGGGMGDVATRLAIVNTRSVDIELQDERFVVSADDPALIGLSENSINTAAADYGDALIFDFANTKVGERDLLSALFVTKQPNGDLVLQEVSNAFIKFFESVPGVFDPVSNYGGLRNIETAALFRDFNDDGLLDVANNGYDLNFRATFSITRSIQGDFDASGSVEQGDLNLVLNSWGSRREFEDAISILDTAIVDQEELNAVLNNWGSSLATPQSDVTIPEPISSGVFLSVLWLGKRGLTSSVILDRA